MEIEKVKEDWELNRLKRLKEDEERKAEQEEDEMMFTYGKTEVPKKKSSTISSTSTNKNINKTLNNHDSDNNDDIGDADDHKHNKKLKNSNLVNDTATENLSTRNSSRLLNKKKLFSTFIQPDIVETQSRSELFKQASIKFNSNQNYLSYPSHPSSSSTSLNNNNRSMNTRKTGKSFIRSPITKQIHLNPTTSTTFNNNNKSKRNTQFIKAKKTNKNSSRLSKSLVLNKKRLKKSEKRSKSQNSDIVQTESTTTTTTSTTLVAETKIKTKKRVDRSLSASKTNPVITPSSPTSTSLNDSEKIEPKTENKLIKEKKEEVPQRRKRKTNSSSKLTISQISEKMKAESLLINEAITKTTTTTTNDIYNIENDDICNDNDKLTKSLDLSDFIQNNSINNLTLNRSLNPITAIPVSTLDTKNEDWPDEPNKIGTTVTPKTPKVKKPRKTKSCSNMSRTIANMKTELSTSLITHTPPPSTVQSSIEASPMPLIPQQTNIPIAKPLVLTSQSYQSINNNFKIIDNSIAKSSNIINKSNLNIIKAPGTNPPVIRTIIRPSTSMFNVNSQSAISNYNLKTQSSKIINLSAVSSQPKVASVGSLISLYNKNNSSNSSSTPFNLTTKQMLPSSSTTTNLKLPITTQGTNSIINYQQKPTTTNTLNQSNSVYIINNSNRQYSDYIINPLQHKTVASIAAAVAKETSQKLIGNFLRTQQTTTVASPTSTITNQTIINNNITTNNANTNNYIVNNNNNFTIITNINKDSSSNKSDHFDCHQSPSLVVDKISKSNQMNDESMEKEPFQTSHTN
jgi:hypothetical protein